MLALRITAPHPHPSLLLPLKSMLLASLCNSKSPGKSCLAEKPSPPRHIHVSDIFLRLSLPQKRLQTRENHPENLPTNPEPAPSLTNHTCSPCAGCLGNQHSCANSERLGAGRGEAEEREKDLPRDLQREGQSHGDSHDDKLKQVGASESHTRKEGVTAGCLYAHACTRKHTQVDIFLRKMAKTIL